MEDIDFSLRVILLVKLSILEKYIHFELRMLGLVVVNDEDVVSGVSDFTADVDHGVVVVQVDQSGVDVVDLLRKINGGPLLVAVLELDTRRVGRRQERRRRADAVATDANRFGLDVIVRPLVQWNSHHRVHSH